MSLNNNFYSGDAGSRYFEHRTLRRSDEIQRLVAQKFVPFISKEDVVLDFGCGTGGILEQFQCERRIGIEVNEKSVGYAREKGIEVHANLEEIDDQCVTACISHHALEHVQRPYEILVKLRRVLKKNGRLILITPAEHPSRCGHAQYSDSDLDQHLYCWNGRTLGNLVTTAGFKVLQSKVVPVGESRYLKMVRGIPVLNSVGRRLVAVLKDRYEVRCVATVE